MALVGALLRPRGRLFDSRRYQRFVLAMGPAGFAALLAGWITTEAGRQPWVVYGVLRTADAVSPVTSQSVSLSLMTLVITYCIVFGTGIYYILRLIHQGPPSPDARPRPMSPPEIDQTGRRPLAVVE